MKKSITIILVLSVLVTAVISTGCRKGEKEPEATDAKTADATEPKSTTTAVITTEPKKTKAAKTTDTEEIVDVANPAYLEIPINENEEGEPSEYAPMIAYNSSYGWTPGVLSKRVPDGMADIVEEARAFIDYNSMNFYIGVVDLLDPVNGYRHIDNSGEIHPSSVIKAWIAEYAYMQIANGNGNLDDVVGGSTLRYHIREMMRMSDNGSTANVISYFGRKNIDSYLETNYGYTRLHSDLRGNYSQGRTNASSVSDSITLLEKIWHNRGSEVYAPIIDLMFNSSTRAKLPSALAGFANAYVASKTGSFIYYNAADHDIGIVVEYDEYGQVILAYAIAIYTFSRPYEPTFSHARNTLFQVAFNVHCWFKHYAENPIMTEPPTVIDEPPVYEPPVEEPQTQTTQAPAITNAPATTTTPNPTTAMTTAAPPPE